MKKHSIRFIKYFSAGTALFLGVAAHAFAEDAPLKFKLTLGGYHYSENGNGVDVNLRHTSDYGQVWLGYFKAPNENIDAHQLRGGWQQSFGDVVRVTPSAQLAAGGFVGGSINVETGERWVIGAGFGRTNLRPYYNLNFDPNDAWSITGGYHPTDAQSFSFSYTRDNRQNPDQQHFHLTSQTKLADKERLTLDLLYKRGLVDGDQIQRLGGTITYDWPRFFVRVAYDPKTNFTTDNQWRLSIGARF